MTLGSCKIKIFWGLEDGHNLPSNNISEVYPYACRFRFKYSGYVATILKAGTTTNDNGELTIKAFKWKMIQHIKLKNEIRTPHCKYM